MGKYSAVLLPAEEITDPDNETNAKWIPELDDDVSDEFYPSESQHFKTEKIDKKMKKKKTKVSTNKQRSKAVSEDSADSEEEETITMETTE